MNENAKTLTFLGVAVVAVAVAVFARPSLPIATVEDMQNKPLYPAFDDPLSVTSLEIVEFDDDRGEVHPLKVAQVSVNGKNRWSIPSHEDYPADAKDQVASAASGLMGLKVIEVVSDNQGDQREYGVVDPNPKTLKMGDTGVGKRVTMKDKSGKEVLALIVGKEVPGRPGLRYARKVGQSAIYIVDAKTDRLSTKFEDWIERNLLGINSFDIKRIWIRDHAVDQLNMALIQRGEMVVGYDDAGQVKWKLVDDRKYVAKKDSPGEGEWVSSKMPADQQLNEAKLDELKTALDDLKIVDVARKPAGLSADLKAARDITANEDAIRALQRMGFFVAEVKKDQVELFSNDGEIRIAMKNGVEYVLRFGEIAGAGSSRKDDKAKDKDGEPGKESKGAGVNRYLFVMADYNPDILPKPKLEPLPEAKADEKKDDAKKADDKKALDAEREKVEKENKRKQDEYDQKVAEAKKRVAELNDRFADWYYVISDDVYRKIHLGHDDVFKKKEKAEEAKDPSAKESVPKTEPTAAEIIDKLHKEGPGGGGDESEE